MKICSIASGSSGNAVYIGNNNTHILIDLGISTKKAEEALRIIGVEPIKINAILVTHEHSDHIKGIGCFTRKYSTKVFATKETLYEITRCENRNGVNPGLLNVIEPDTDFYIDDLKISVFRISHDAKNPVCFTFECDNHKYSLATDLGTYNEYLVSKLINSEVLYLEANHDTNMLMVGPYPYVLKRRIAGERGHLSNDASAELICKLLNTNLKMIYLAHLSKDNNFAQLAYETVRAEVCKYWNFNDNVPQIVVANRDIPSVLYES